MKRLIKYVVICAVIAVLGILIGPEHKANAASRKTLDIGKGDVTITKNGDYNLTGTTSEHSITVEKGVKANIWMKDVTINTSKYGETLTFKIEDKATVNLNLSGTNTITSSAWSDYSYDESTTFDAIKLGKGAKLTVDQAGTGSLELHANGYGCGIGGQGTLTINGGTIIAYGGTYGAGIGNTLDPSKMQVTINGGMVSAYAGIGTRESDSWEYQNLYRRYADLKICDISASKITITGGMVMAADTSVVPVNKKGSSLYRQIFNCRKGKFKKITIDKTAYGCAGINSKGYLSIWTPSRTSKIELTYANGIEETKNGTYSGISGDNFDKDLDYDIETGSFLFINYGFIYKDHVYRYMWDDNKVKITGATTDNCIMIEADANLIFDSVNVIMENSSNPFLTVGNNAEATIEFNGSSDFTASGNDTVMLVGNHAKLYLAESKPKNEVNLVLNGQSKGIYTECGTIEQYGCCILANTDESAKGIYVGSGGLYELDNGELISNSNEGKTLHVLADGTVKVCGGKISAVKIGFCDEANEEVTDNSRFILIGGNVKVSNRMMFGKFIIYGGELSGHLVGSGSGSQYYQYGGNVVMDRFITNYYMSDEEEDAPYSYDSTTKQIEGSAIEKDKVYGGTLTESGKVTTEELEKVSFGRC